MSRLSYIIGIAICLFSPLHLFSQRTVMFSGEYLYSSPDMNAEKMNLAAYEEYKEVEWLDSVHPHTYTYTYKAIYLNKNFEYSCSSFFAKVKLDEITGYAHSSQLDGYGSFSYPQKIILENVQLKKLHYYKPCSDGQEVTATFLLDDGTEAELPIPFSKFYSVKYDDIEGCILISHQFMLNHSFNLSFSAGRWADELMGGGLMNHIYCSEVNFTENNTTNLNCTVNGTNVNIRKGPSKSVEVLGQLNPGDNFVIKEVVHDEKMVGDYYGSWVRIIYKNIEGWVFSTYVIPVN